MCPSCQAVGCMRLAPRVVGPAMEVVTGEAGLVLGMHVPQFICGSCTTGVLPKRVCRSTALMDWHDTERDEHEALMFLICAGGYWPATPTHPKRVYAQACLNRRTIEENVQMGASAASYVAELDAVSSGRGVAQTIRAAQFVECHGEYKAAQFWATTAVEEFGTVDGIGLCPLCSDVLRHLQVEIAVSGSA